jgi:hypothetical protein
MTWQELAKFNWGTDDQHEVNAFMRDELGCHKRDADNNFVFATDDEPKGDPLLIPKAFKRPGLPIDKTHVLKVKKKAAPKQFLECACIPGVTFEFDKSFVRPSVVDDLKKLEEALTKHPDGKLMIFGHTDKVGSEAYNKKLSERRAKSVFAFITNDAAVWEALYNEENWGTRVIQEMLVDFGFDPGPVDGINGPKTQAAVREYQEARGLSVDGVAGPATRNKMFTEYMSSKHDIKVTAGQFMDPKHMGCSEFNPVEATEAANEPNRRVTIFLFNPARLPKLPCKFVDIAPCKKQMTPPSPRFKATFKCSFFDSLARDCKCEGGDTPPPPPPVVRPATIEIINAAGAVATAVRIGLWDNAFDAAGTLLNAADEPNNFAGADTRRFHFRVNDPEATGSFVNITWKSLTSVKTDLDSAGASLTLPETAPGSKTFVSRGLLLTCDVDDVNQKTNSGLTAPLPDPGDRNRGQSNHRLKTAQMDGFLKGEYTPTSGAPAVSVELPVFERTPDERRRLPLQIFVLRVAPGGAGVVPTAPGSAIWTTDIRVFKETYERIGLKVETVVAPGTPAGDIVTVDGLSIVLINAPAGVIPVAVTLADEATIGGAFPAVGHTVRVFYTGGLTSGVRGEAAPDVDFAGAPDQGTAFVDGPGRTPYTAAHETGHMLTNKTNALNTGHYNAPSPADGNRFFNNQNLMRNGTSAAEGVNQSKRLWDVADVDGNNGFTASRGSPYTRPF